MWQLWRGSIYCNTFLWHCSKDRWPQPDKRRLWEIQPDQPWPPLAESRVCVPVEVWSSKGSLDHSVSKLHQRGWVVPTGLVVRIRIRGEANFPHPSKCQINSSGVIGCYLTVRKQEPPLHWGILDKLFKLQQYNPHNFLAEIFSPNPWPTPVSQVEIRHGHLGMFYTSPPHCPPYHWQKRANFFKESSCWKTVMAKLG